MQLKNWRPFSMVNDLMPKSPTASTGHDSGALQRASLRTILHRDRMGMKALQSARVTKNAAKRARRKTSGYGSKGRSMVKAALSAETAERQKRDAQAREARATNRPGLGSRLLGGLKRFLSRAK
jgi:hypothetical protein